MKKNAVGVIGVVLACAVAVLMSTVGNASNAQTMWQLDGAIVVVFLSLIAAVRGSWRWLILSAVGIAEMTIIIRLWTRW